MSDLMTVRGFVATDPRTNTTHGGDIVSSFRLAVTERRYDREAGAWTDGHTNWFTVVGFRQLASNMCGSLKKGQRVIVVGRLRLKQWEKDGRIYHAAEIEAESVGHDLYWGSAKFARNHQDAQRQESTGQRVAVDGVGVVDLATGEVPPNSEEESGLSGSPENPRAEEVAENEDDPQMRVDEQGTRYSQGSAEDRSELLSA